LVDKDGSEFDFRDYSKLSTRELIKQGVLPDIKGAYDKSYPLIDGLIISHAHQDHYGLSNFIYPKVKFYLGKATHKIIELSSLFTPQKIRIKKPIYFEKERTFTIGEFSITPYWVDHSAFDAYSFLIEADGKRLFYSGDFRNHGRKSKVFKWFLHNAPKNVDYLLLEGTTIGRQEKTFRTEQEIESQLVQLFKEKGKINLIYTSGQNIDRIVSIYKACLRTNRILVVDVYVASVLNELSKFANLPFPSKDFSNLYVMFPFFLSRKLSNAGNEEILYQFKNYKITKKEISKKYSETVMIVRPSLQKDLSHIRGIDGGNFIYSIWKGYLKKPDIKRFINYLEKRKFKLYKIHTSGHADIATLKELVGALKPKYIIPIHTFHGSEYKSIFTAPIMELKDGESNLS